MVIGRIVLLLAIVTSIGTGEDARDVLRRMQQSIGNIRSAEIHDFDWIVKGKVWDGSGAEAGYVTRRIRVILPYRFRKDQDMSLREAGQGPSAHTKFYFDGTAGWGTFADMVQFKDTPVTELSGSELKMVRKEVRGFWLNLWRTDGTAEYGVTLSGPHVLRFLDTSDNTAIGELELDPATWLPRCSGSCTAKSSGNGSYAETVEWTTVDGIKVPQRILNYHSGHLLADIRTVSAKFNTGLKAADLAHRPDSK
jgi:hypothetical protein